MIVIFSTFPEKESAERVIKELLLEKLIACGSISSSITSSYWWQGKIEHSQEFQVILKAPSGNYEEIETFIKKEHPFDVPEIFSVKAEKIEKEYNKWLIEETEV